MPRSATANCSAPIFLPDALPDALPAVEEPPATAPAGGAKVIQLMPTPVFRVGDYEVGEGYCPCLHGHPDIRD